MFDSFLSISLLSASCAFGGTLLIVYSVLTVLRWRRLWIWSSPSPSPESVVAALSNEDKEKIEKLRSSAILRHLNKYSMTLGKHNMTGLNSTTEEEGSTTSCISTEDSTSVEEENNEEAPQQIDIEEGTNDDKTQYSHICVPLPGQQICISSTNGIDATNETTSLNDMPETRNVPNLCVICHEEYTSSDKVCWASSSDCSHVFHEECIVRWLTRLGWMKLRKQSIELENMIDEDKCLNYDLDCPMCRGQFICKDDLKKNTPVVTAATGEENV